MIKGLGKSVRGNSNCNLLGLDDKKNKLNYNNMKFLIE